MALVCTPTPPSFPKGGEEFAGVRLPPLQSCLRRTPTTPDTRSSGESSVESLPHLPENPRVRFARVPTPPFCPRPPPADRPRKKGRSFMLRIPEHCKHTIMSAEAADRRSLVTFLLCLRRLGCANMDSHAGLWARNRRNLWLASDLMGDVLGYLVRRASPLVRAVIVDSNEAPALNGRYTILSGTTHEGMSVWSCGRRRLYSNRGLWCVVHGEDNMRVGEYGLCSALAHGGQGPHQVCGWRHGSCVTRAAPNTVVRAAAKSPTVWLSPDCG